MVYQCGYHIVWCPKYRYRILKGGVGEVVETMVRSLCEWKRVEVLEVNVREDHIHLMGSMPPKLAISRLMGILKGKTAIKLFERYPGLKRRPYWGNHFWSRGYCVSTIGLDEEKIRRYVRYQDENERLAEADGEEYSLF